MSSIVLMRHGEPAGVSRTAIPARDMGTWIEAYDAAGIADAPPHHARTVAERAMVILSSPLPRALASARLLAGDRPVAVEPDAREAALPFADWSVPRLPPALWAAPFRMGWFCGWHPRVESLQDARARAGRVADRLIRRAEERRSILLVGHGIANRLIASALRQRGWKRVAASPSGYWQWREYGWKGRGGLRLP